DKLIKEKQLKPIYRNGYLSVTLCNDGKRRTFNIHRLVAENFIKPISLKNYVNHKDGNKKNNNIYNLEWVTPIENSNHARFTGLFKNRDINYKIVQKNKLGEIINIFSSIRQAEKETNICRTTISLVCRGFRKTSGGYNWEFINYGNITSTTGKSTTPKRRRNKRSDI